MGGYTHVILGFCLLIYRNCRSYFRIWRDRIRSGRNSESRLRYLSYLVHYLAHYGTSSIYVIDPHSQITDEKRGTANAVPLFICKAIILVNW